MGKRFVSIYFQNLVVDWFIIRHPQLRAVPFVLTAMAHGRKMVTAANAHALRHGAAPGMVLADARAIVPALEDYDPPPDLIARLLQKLAEFCIRFTPVVAIDPPDGLILDATGCAHLWGNEEKYIDAIMDRLQKRGYQVRATLADTMGSAWAMARFGTEKIIHHYSAILSLSSASLRLDTETIALLDKLGLRRINDFINFERPALHRRFGPLLLQRLDEAMGNIEEIITPILIPSPYEERLYSLEPISTRPGIEIALQKIMEALCNRLRKNAKGLRHAKFTCYRVDAKIESIEIGTNRPSCNVAHLYHLFSLKLDNIEPALGIELFILEANQVEEHIPAQSKLWEDNGGWNDEQLGELIDRITSKFGKAPIHRYLPAEHYIPERSVKEATSIDELPTTDWKLDRPRPLHLLKNPAPIQVTAPIPDYPPMNFRYKGTLHIIRSAEGPERIEQEWWIEEGEHRDYYFVEDENAERYWIFRRGHYTDGQQTLWFLHGIFT